MSQSMVLCVSIVLFSFGVCATYSAAADARQITVKEAETLLSEALEGSEMTKLPDFGLNDFASSPGFYSRWYLFTGTWAGASNGSAITGNWAIDKKTGEVWNAVICEQLASPGLTRMQEAIRNRIGLSPAEYSKIRVDGPVCDRASAKGVK
jgi:hypothetical protein